MGSKILTMCALLCCVFLSVSFAQEEEEYKSVDYSYGTVVSVDGQSNRITINENDWENDVETKVTYSVDPSVHIEGASSWKNIPKDSYVDIEYITDTNGKKIVKSISVYES